MSKVRVSLIQNRGFIFDANDYLQMRAEHRIIGNLVGCAANCPRNINVNGLPAVLTACELQLLFDQRLATVQPGDRLAQAPDHQLATTYSTFCAQSEAEQRALQRTGKVNESRLMIDRILAGKRLKLAASGASPEECAALSAEQLLHETGEQCVFNADNVLVQVPTMSALADDGMPDKGDEADDGGLKDVVGCLSQVVGPPSLQYRVFRDLWQRGKYVTPGDTFGCDFLVYPGDPMLYHASHIVHCLAGPIDAAQLVAAGRLSVLVNKLCVFAYEGADGALAYQTLEWEGNDLTES